MKPQIKKIASIFFLLLGCAPLAFVIFISLKKESIHHRMEERMKLEQGLQTVVLPEDDIVWMDKHEIWVNNQMFDIHSKKIENGIYTFTGLYDADETFLVEQQQDATEKDEEDDKLLIHFLKSLHNIYYNPPQEFYPISEEIKNQYYITNSALATQAADILTPPPQV